MTASAARALLAITLVLFCLPLAPLMPGWGLDASFALAVAQAQADGLVFGRQVIFTLGPYAPLYTALYHPGTDDLMLAAGSLLAVGYATICWQLRLAPLAAVLAALLLASLFTSRDALLLCYPLLALLAVLRGRHGSILLGAPLGLLLLTKGSLLPLVLLALITAAIVLLRRGEGRRALCFVGSAVLAVPVLWLLAGQPLDALGVYWRGQLPLISGFADAMSSNGPQWQVLLWLAMAAIVALVVALQPWSNSGRWPWMLNLLALLFVAFKAGFVRHDMHAVIASDCLLLLACLLLGVATRRLSAGVALLASLLAWQQLDVMYPYADRPPVYARAAGFYEDKVQALWSRIWHPERLDQRFWAALEALQQRYDLPSLTGGVDIYSANQAELLASRNRWQPRPVFQSYTAYTPWLAARNREFLRSADVPEHLLLRIEPIDGRLPALEDGASWATLVQRYRLRQQAGNGYLYLQRRPAAQASAPLAPTLRLPAHLGQALLVPEGAAGWQASVEVRKSLRGQVWGLLYKAQPLRLGVELADGRHLDYRFVPGMAVEPIPLSPLVGDTDDFARLLRGEPTFFARNRVVAINLYCPGGCRDWASDWQLRLAPLPAALAD